MDQSDTFTLACRSIVQDRCAESEQRLLTNILQARQLLHYPRLLIGLFEQDNLSFYDLCPVDSFERVN